MSIFRRNPNEVAYSGGQKHIIDRIENTGDGDLLFWRQPEEDFNTNSPLVVYPGTEAIFLEDGVFRGILAEGKHNLRTDNIPFLSRFRNLMSGGISTFPCRIYFIKTNVSKEIGFGGRILVRDPEYDVTMPIQYYGGYNVIVTNTGKFAEKLVGDGQYRLSPQELEDWMKSRLSQTLQMCLRKTFKSSQEELIDTCAQVDVVSEQVSEQFAKELEEYGLSLENLAFDKLDVDENSLEYQKFNEHKLDRMGKRTDAEGEARARRISAQSKKEELETMGGAYTTIKGMEMLQTIAENPGAGGIASAGAGLGMGMAAGTAFGSIAQSIFSGVQQQPQQPRQSTFGGTDRFGTGANENASATPAPQAQDPVELLEKMKVMLDKGLISQAKYDEKVTEILSRM